MSTSETEDAPWFDFGEFSCRSLGVTLTIPPELARFDPDVPGSVVALLLAGNMTERIEVLRKAYARQVNPTSRFVVAGCESCFQHELRHYHDYLATPFGARTFEDFMLAACFFPRAMYWLRDEPTVGLPLPRWQTLTPALQAAYSSQTRSGTFRSPPEPLGELTRGATALLSRVAARLAPQPRVDDALATRQLLEASALSIQFERIEAIFGRDAMVEFTEVLKRHPDADAYVGTWAWCNYIAGEISPGKRFSPTVMNALILYALCGTDPSEEWGHPVARLAAALTVFKEAQFFPEDDTILDALDFASKGVEIPTIAESLTKSIERQRMMAEDFNGLTDDQRLCEGYEAWAAAHEHMASKILEDPLTYLNPERYILAIDDFVAAPVYLSGSGTAFASQSPILPMFKNAGWQYIYGMGDEQSEEGLWEVQLLYSPDTSVGKALISPEQAIHMSWMIWLTCAMWAPAMLSPMQRRIASMMLKRAFKEANRDCEILLL